MLSISRLPLKIVLLSPQLPQKGKLSREYPRNEWKLVSHHVTIFLKSKELIYILHWLCLFQALAT